MVDPIRGDMGISDTQISLLHRARRSPSFTGSPASRLDFWQTAFRGATSFSPAFRCGVWARSLAVFRTTSVRFCASRIVVGLGRGGTVSCRHIADQRLFSAVTTGHCRRIFLERHCDGQRRGHSHRGWRFTRHRIGRSCRHASGGLRTVADGIARDRGARTLVGDGHFAHPRARSSYGRQRADLRRRGGWQLLAGYALGSSRAHLYRIGGRFIRRQRSGRMGADAAHQGLRQRPSSNRGRIGFAVNRGLRGGVLIGGALADPPARAAAGRASCAYVCIPAC